MQNYFRKLAAAPNGMVEFKSNNPHVDDLDDSDPMSDDLGSDYSRLSRAGQERARASADKKA